MAFAKECLCQLRTNVIKVFSMQARRCSNTTANSQSEQQSKGFVDKLYDQGDTNKILSILNDAQPKELKRKRINPKIIETVCKSRPFTTLTQVIQMQGMDIIKFDRLCNLLLTKTKSNKEDERIEEKKETERFTLAPRDFHPHLDTNTAAQIKTITAIGLNFERSQWIQMSCDLAVMRCYRHNMSFNKGSAALLKYDHVAFLEEVKQFFESIPPTDAYVIDNRNPSRPLKPGPMQVVHALQLLDATFCAHAASQSEKQLIYAINPGAVDRLFNLSVGTERVTSASAIADIQTASKWSGYDIKDLDILQTYLGSITSSLDKEAARLLFLRCLAFIVGALLQR